jgi:hypothetical protein
VRKLKNRLLSLIDNTKSNQLISVATDGEVYGHHEPFGDMCLAALISNNQQNKDFIITNYGNYLELFPPKDEVMIKKWVKWFRYSLELRSWSWKMARKLWL